MLYNHIPDKEFNLQSHENALMKKNEQAQYFAALAVNGTWKDTLREKLFVS